MTKKIIKLYLEDEIIRKLRIKANELGFEGRGDIARYIEKIAKEDIAFLDNNFKKVAKLFVTGLK